MGKTNEKQEFWVSPGEIKWTRPQVVFLLYNYLLLFEGVWPPDPRETGYEGKSRMWNGLAPFEKVSQVKVELDERIALLNYWESICIWEAYIEGKLRREDGLDEYYIAEELRVTPSLVFGSIEYGLRKLCGASRKRKGG